MNTREQDGAAVAAGWDAALVQKLYDQLTRIRASLLDAEQRYAPLEAGLNPGRHASVRNLVHYLALRRHDIHSLQGELASIGLSSLGRAEPHVMDSVNAVLKVLAHLAGRPWEPPENRCRRSDTRKATRCSNNIRASFSGRIRQTERSGSW